MSGLVFEFCLPVFKHHIKNEDQTKLLFPIIAATIAIAEFTSISLNLPSFEYVVEEPTERVIEGFEEWKIRHGFAGSDKFFPPKSDTKLEKCRRVFMKGVSGSKYAEYCFEHFLVEIAATQS